MTRPTWDFSHQLTWEQVCAIKARIDRQPVPALWRLMEINQHNTNEWVVSLFRTQSPMRVEKITDWAYWQQFRVNELETAGLVPLPNHMGPPPEPTPIPNHIGDPPEPTPLAHDPYNHHGKPCGCDLCIQDYWME